MGQCQLSTHFGSLSLSSSPTMSLQTTSKGMGLPSCEVGMIDEFAACSSTPHHAAFAAEHGTYSKAVLCGWSPELVDGRFRYEWSAATPPFYEEPSLFVDMAVCEVSLVSSVVLCLLAPVGVVCVRCVRATRTTSRVTAGLPVFPPLDLRGYLLAFLLQCECELCAAGL